MTTKKNYDTLLRSFKTNESEHTHTRIGDKTIQIFGGKYNIDHNIEKFNCSFICNFTIMEINYNELKLNSVSIKDIRFLYDLLKERDSKANISDRFISGIQGDEVQFYSDLNHAIKN